ncbi:hypothetical protein OJ997_15635 [Solirubrobacter phytolaccae]|uniref:Uncharacterized protein n=1 Tax=Solirubrobacter phytolaccae TaxID=1404360 RepID=A0A9X3NCZ1_9ACTN|nr:hypothetical protein [Solirubrobacter phytolaccae]MDA0181736.1 hypothetical protein [Solirubrobacter phytolaccae]
MGLPPELDRLGTALTHAATRHRARRERQRRLAGGIAAGLLVFAAMTPAQLERADQTDILGFAITSSAQAAEVCDQPRGPRFDIDKTCEAGHPAPQAVR